MPAGARIAEIETIPLHIPVTTAGASLWGERLSAVDSLLVKVTTGDGVEGWGEAFGYGAAGAARLAIDELIAPLCIGRDATGIGPLMLAVQQRLHVFGRGGPLKYGLSAVDIALWDIAGKLAGTSVCGLLGGGASSMGCYASLPCYSAPDPVRAAVRGAIDAGFSTIKLHESQLPAIRAAREEAGPGIELIADIGCSWTLAQAQAAAEELTAVRLKFLEEPLWPPENFDGLAELRSSTGLRVSAGENVSTLMEFERLLAAGAVDFAQPSPAKLGGITEACKVFPLAAVHNVPVLAHSFYGGPGLLAAIQVSAALGGADAMIEWCRLGLQASVYGDRLAPAGGSISVPPGPGLGVDPDPEVVEAYRLR